MRRRNTRSKFGRYLIVSILVLLFLAGGTTAALVAAGYSIDELAFWLPRPSEPMIELPINAVTLTAYERIRRDDLINPATGSIATLSIPLDAAEGQSVVAVGDDGKEFKDRVTSVEATDSGLLFHLKGGQSLPRVRITSLGGAFLHANEIVGRVLKRDKPPGLAFSERLFFESGTPAGLAGAVGPGMRGLTVEAEQLTGVHRARQGDKIDLVANIPLNRVERFELATSSSLPGAQLVADGRRQGGRDSERETTARLVAKQAEILTPVSRRVTTERTASLTNGASVLAVPVEEVVLAVAAEDVAALTAALELKATISVVIRSGRKGAKTADRSAVPDGQIAVPIPGKTLLAYQSIDSGVFEEAATGFIRYRNIAEETVKAAGWVTELSDLIGRVPSRDLPVGQPIKKMSLMPVGTTSGLSGATPPGRRLFYMDRSSLNGADAFEFGQRLDIVSSITEDANSGALSGRLSVALRTRVEPIADDVVVVMPTRSPANPTAIGEEDGAGQLIIAVRPDQIGPLEFAVATEANLRATVRPANLGSSLKTGQLQPNVPLDFSSMGFNPLRDAKVTDWNVGGRRHRTLFIPKSSDQ